MDFDAHFHAFLVSTVNLKAHKLKLLDDRVASIVAAFVADEEMGPLYKEHLPQGSWAHRTIIEPVGEFDEFDADFLLHLTPVEEWEDEPREYIRQIRAAFKRTTTYANMLQRKNRCVRIQYANSCHVDVVPCITSRRRDPGHHDVPGERVRGDEPGRVLRTGCGSATTSRTGTSGWSSG